MLRKTCYLGKQLLNLRSSREEIERLQLASLKRIVAHAYGSVPYYRGLFDKAGLLPDEITTLSDIERIPITTKDDLRCLPTSQRLASAYSPCQLIMHCTSGTTGQPMEFCRDKRSDDLRSAALYRMYIVNGYRPNDTIANLMFYSIQDSFLRRIGLLKRVAIPFDLPLDSQLEMLVAIQPQVLEGYASRISTLAARLIEREINTIRPRLIFTNSETLTDNMKQTIRSGFAVEPTNVYDSCEYGVVAWECPKHEGLHINVDLFIVEILRNRREVEAGESGEVVVTDLYNNAMPMIRYATGDVAVKISNVCSCGSAFPLIAGILGRTTDKIFLSDGTTITVTTQLVCIIEEFPGIREFQIVQNIKGHLEILIVCDDRFTSSFEGLLQKRILTAFKLHSVTITRVQSIEKTSVGKRLPFLSTIDH